MEWNKKKKESLLFFFFKMQWCLYGHLRAVDESNYAKAKIVSFSFHFDSFFCTCFDTNQCRLMCCWCVVMCCCRAALILYFFYSTKIQIFQPSVSTNSISIWYPLALDDTYFNYFTVWSLKKRLHQVILHKHKTIVSNTGIVTCAIEV